MGKLGDIVPLPGKEFMKLSFLNPRKTGGSPPHIHTQKKFIFGYENFANVFYWVGSHKELTMQKWLFKENCGVEWYIKCANFMFC